MTTAFLSMLALTFGAPPETQLFGGLPDRHLSFVFREVEDDSVVVPAIVRPDWLQPIPRPAGSTIIRGQSPPGTYETPPMGSPFASPMQPYQPSDPFNAGGIDPVVPYLPQPPAVVISGINGPQPQRFGFTPNFDASYISASGAKSPGAGNLTVQEYNGSLRYVSMLGPDWVMSNTAEGGARIWDGPSFPALPGSVFRFGWDVLLHSPQYGRWSGQLDFNPSINTDMHSSLGREAFNLDANASVFYTVSPQLMVVLGVQYWDRVDNIIIPNVGVVWNPTDRLELRLLFPKSRISYFLGNFGNASHWIYATGEYHTEAYQITMPATGRDQVQMTDWRLAVGLRSDHSWYDKFVEVGYVFDRKVDYLNSAPGFNLNDGLMLRLGVHF